MASERLWVGIPTQLFTSNGGSEGQVSIPSTEGIKVKQVVYVLSNTQPEKQLEVKFVSNETDIILGPVKGPMRGVGSTTDLSLYLSAANSFLRIEPQQRPTIINNDIFRALYEEEPTVALRTFAVDHLGRKYSADNPFPVQLSNGSIDIGTVNAQLEMFITHKDNDPHAGDVHSSMRIGDGTNEAAVNPDGSFNVVVVNGGAASKETKTVFNQISAVPVGSETLIATYTVPPAKTAILDRITASGENIGKFNVYLNSALFDVRRTYYTGGFNVSFEYVSQGLGIVLQSGDVVELKVIQETDNLGDFDGRLQLVELG